MSYDSGSSCQVFVLLRRRDLELRLWFFGEDTLDCMTSKGSPSHLICVMNSSWACREKLPSPAAADVRSFVKQPGRDSRKRALVSVATAADYPRPR